MPIWAYSRRRRRTGGCAAPGQVERAECGDAESEPALLQGDQRAAAARARTTSPLSLARRAAPPASAGGEDRAPGTAGGPRGSGAPCRDEPG
jgi:hypothetical protein